VGLQKGRCSRRENTRVWAGVRQTDSLSPIAFSNAVTSRAYALLSGSLFRPMNTRKILAKPGCGQGGGQRPREPGQQCISVGPAFRTRKWSRLGVLWRQHVCDVHYEMGPSLLPEGEWSRLEFNGGRDWANKLRETQSGIAFQFERECRRGSSRVATWANRIVQRRNCLPSTALISVAKRSAAASGLMARRLGEPGVCDP
jgi:hypothetical protein